MKLTKRTIRNNRPTERLLTLNSLLTMVKSERTGKSVANYRKQLYASLSAFPKKETTVLPTLLFAGSFCQETLLAYNGCVTLEIDHLADFLEAENVRNRVAGYPQTLLAMTGANGRSVLFVLPYTRPDGSLPQTRAEAERFHAAAYKHAVNTFEPRLGYPIVLQEPVLERAYPLSYDAEAYYNADAMPIHLITSASSVPTDPNGQPGKKEYPAPESEENLYRRHRYASTQFELAFRQALQTPAEASGSVDLKTILHQVARYAFGAGIAEEDCVRWCLLYLGEQISEVELRATICNVYSVGTGFGNKPVIIPEQVQAYQMEEFMQRRYEFRHNTLTDAPEYREHHSFCFHFRPITKAILNSITLDAQKEGLQLWDRDVQRYIYSNRLRPYSPIEDWLQKLPVWDGTDRIRPLAARIPCDNPQWEELFYRWLLSMVAHWQGRDQSHSNSVSPLLVGGQGCGKSTFCLNLIPPELKMYYTDSIDFSKRRDAELYLTRFALINIDEFDQVNLRYQGFLKHLLQKPVVNIRKPYATQVEATKRYASFIATSNQVDLLSNTSGSRRFICIEVKGMIDNGQPIEYGQLYAQAVAALESGERYWMTHDEEQAQMARNEPFQQRPLHEELFYHYYRPATEGEKGVLLTTGEVLLSLQQKSGIKIAPSKSVPFGRFLRKVVALQENAKRGHVYRVVELKV